MLLSLRKLYSMPLALFRKGDLEENKYGNPSFI